MSRVRRERFAVVGCGLLGLAASVELARRGHEVIAFEQAAAPGHEWSGSKGISRIFRLSYDEPIYVRMAAESLPLWRDLEQGSGEPLLTTTGLLSFGAQLEELAAAMAAEGAAAEVLDAGSVARQYPGLAIGGPAVLDPAAGVIAADRVLRALAGLASAAGVDLRFGVAVQGVEPGEGSVRVLTRDGAVEAAAAVICAGPGSAALARTAGIEYETYASLEQVAWFRVTERDLPCVVRRMDPGEAVETIGVYGLPAGRGSYKFGLHQVGPHVTAGGLLAGVHEEMLATLTSAATELIEGLDPAPTYVERCVYDNTVDGHFVLDRVGSVVVGSGTSGHGFKFGPLLGRVLADLACGADPGVDLRLFSLSRPRGPF